MKPTVLVIAWITLLVVVLGVSGTRFYANHVEESYKERDRHIKEMGEACLHHVHNLSASNDANLKDLYSVGLNNPQQTKLLAVLDCMQRYPLYSDQPSYIEFNTTTE